MSARYATAASYDVTGGLVPNATVTQKALVTIVSENATVSSVITLNDNCTDLEVSASGAPVFYRWVARSDTQGSVISVAGTANFDALIPSGAVRRLVVPVEQTGTSSTVGANIANGLYNRIAYKTGGIGSVFTTQY